MAENIRDSHPQAVPAEDVARLVERMRATGGKGQCGPLKMEAAASLTRVTEERDAYIKACDDYERDLARSEAEATSLRRKLEEAKRALEPFGRNASASSLAKVYAHLTREHAQTARKLAAPLPEDTHHGR